MIMMPMDNSLLGDPIVWYNILAVPVEITASKVTIAPIVGNIKETPIRSRIAIINDKNITTLSLPTSSLESNLKMFFILFN